MNASKFMDKQIMDLSRSKSDSDTTKNEFIDLMNPQSEDEDTHGGNKKKDDILPNYDFQPISRPLYGVSPDPPVTNNATSSPTTTADSRAYFDLSKPANSSPLRRYSSVDPVEPEKVVLEKAQKVNDPAIMPEIDRMMKKYTDSLLKAIDSLSAHVSQLESRTRNLEYSVDDLKASIGNNHGSTDGKMRQLENILLEVQTGVQDIKDKQEVMEGHMQLAKLQISKVERSSETPSVVHPEPPVQPVAASAPPQQPSLPQFPVAASQPVASLPPNAPVQPNILPPPMSTTQFPPAQIPTGPQRDAYFSSPGQTQEPPSQHYQIPPAPAQHQHQQQPPAAAPAPQPQQYQPAPTPPYPQPPQPPQPHPPQQHPSVLTANAPPQFQPPLGHHPEEGAYMSAQSYPPNLRQPSSQPSSGPPQSHQYYGSPPTMYEPPASGRSSSGFSSTYGPASGPSEPYPYGGPPPLQYGSGSSAKSQPHSPGRGGASSNYPQLPTARVLPQAIPTAAAVSGGSNSGGSGNRVPIDDVVDKVTNMGFPREHVRATVRKLTENGQSVDLNIVLDKLMNDGDVQPPRGGWFGR